jgi:hypothetical protein
MNEYAILEAARKAMLERFPAVFAAGNVHLVAYAVSAPQVANEDFQIFPSGATFDADAGGNLRRRQTIGVRIWSRVLSDELAKYEELCRAISENARLVIKALHLHYEPELPQQEPFVLEAQSGIRAVESEDGSYAYVELTFRTIVTHPLESILED